MADLNNNSITNAVQGNTPSVFERPNVNYIDKMIVKPKVLAEKILKSNVYGASITIPNPQWYNGSLTWNPITFPLYLTQNFRFGVSNTWKELLDMEATNLFTFASNMLSMGSDGAQVTTQSQAMQAAVWQGSKIDNFSVECIFVCTNRRINPVEIIQTLCKACLPARLTDYCDSMGNGGSNFAKDIQDLAVKGIDGAEGLVNGIIDGTSKAFESLSGKSIDAQGAKDVVSRAAQIGRDTVKDIGMVAPLGYGLTFNQEGRTVAPLPGTTLTLNIGDWFRADELLVESVSGIEFSKEFIAPSTKVKKDPHSIYDSSPEVGATQSGFPLYAKCTIVLRPYTLVDIRKFKSWFPKTYMAAGMHVANETTLADQGKELPH